MLSKQNSFILSCLFNLTILFFLVFVYHPKSKERIIKTTVVFEDQFIKKPTIDLNKLSSLPQFSNSTSLTSQPLKLNKKSNKLNPNNKIRKNNEKIILTSNIKKEKSNIEDDDTNQIQIIETTQPTEITSSTTQIITDTVVNINAKSKNNADVTAQNDKQHYQNRVRIAIQANWKLPNHLIDHEFEAFIKISINKIGQVTDFQLIESSGNKLIDQAIKKAVNDAEPFPKFPTSFSKVSRFIVALQFSDKMEL